MCSERICYRLQEGGEAGGPTINGCAIALLVSIFEHDLELVRQSGDTVVTVTNGIPEGGTMVTLNYTVLPDSLVKTLQQNNHGIGTGYNMPKTWQGR